jgi:hypothetical protein
MKFRQLKFESGNWILQYYDNEEELVTEQFATLEHARAHMAEDLQMQLNFEPPSI